MEILKFEFKNDTEFWVKLYTISLKNKEPPPPVFMYGYPVRKLCGRSGKPHSGETCCFGMMVTLAVGFLEFRLISDREGEKQRKVKMLDKPNTEKHETVIVCVGLGFFYTCVNYTGVGGKQFYRRGLNSRTLFSGAVNAADGTLSMMRNDENGSWMFLCTNIWFCILSAPAAVAVLHSVPTQS